MPSKINFGSRDLTYREFSTLLDNEYQNVLKQLDDSQEEEFRALYRRVSYSIEKLTQTLIVLRKLEEREEIFSKYFIKVVTWASWFTALVVVFYFFVDLSSLDLPLAFLGLLVVISVVTSKIRDGFLEIRRDILNSERILLERDLIVYDLGTIAWRKSEFFFERLKSKGVSFGGEVAVDRILEIMSRLLLLNGYLHRNSYLNQECIAILPYLNPLDSLDNDYEVPR